DAFLPEIAAEKNYGRISGYGFAMGYLGALAILAISFPLIKGGFVPENIFHFRLSFILTAIFFLLFALPFFILIREREIHSARKVPYMRLGFQQTIRTIKQIRGYANIARF